MKKLLLHSEIVLFFIFTFLLLNLAKSQEATDLNGALSVKLTPNPARSSLQIYTNLLEFNRPSTISVMYAPGVLMKTIQLNNLNKVVQLDVSSLVRGVYSIVPTFLGLYIANAVDSIWIRKVHSVEIYHIYPLR
jgi:hypothetical protein